jgi:hypothetical protein
MPASAAITAANAAQPVQSETKAAPFFIGYIYNSKGERVASFGDPPFATDKRVSPQGLVLFYYDVTPDAKGLKNGKVICQVDNFLNIFPPNLKKLPTSKADIVNLRTGWISTKKQYPNRFYLHRGSDSKVLGYIQWDETRNIPAKQLAAALAVWFHDQLKAKEWRITAMDAKPFDSKWQMPAGGSIKKST